ncbi:putative F-box protein At1g67623 [Salvia splendens]|uniref:putative F-box protein At1g67623 n=1 Tax=Salvia splendens TaxID=180675 RepID=UPI001100B686|nr:putative F-box protein At1g67623 [Salvia splendens]
MRMRRFRKKNEVSYLQTIPRELTTQILCRVAASSAADISNIKLSCKELREIAEDGDVYRHACLDKFPILEWSPLCEKKQKFLNRCKQTSNPEIWYREALLDFFKKTDLESAIRNLDKAVKMGHVRALYACCIISLMSGIDQVKEEGIKLMGKMIRNGYIKTRLRWCRRKLIEELGQMWISNPMLKDPPIFCSKLHRCYPKTNNWSDEDDCEACAADTHVQLISSSCAN